jgi:DNA-binding GntR family transcriptional regulator
MSIGSTGIGIHDPLNYAGAPRPVKLSDQIYERIFGLIVSGEFPEKSKLPTEVELAIARAPGSG